jgi:hypothetical protein
MLLIVGGKGDHNIRRLAEAAAWRGAAYRLVHTDADPPPVVSWQPGSSDITVNGEIFSACGTSLFIRYDVFGASPEAAKSAYYDAFKGWADAYPEVGLLNRRNETLEVSKPRALVLAKEAGFETPQTFISSDFNRFADKDAWIAKPVSGGDYARPLGELPEQPDRPYIVQEKLVYPELRLFRAGKHYFAFEIDSKLLDYRIDKDFTLREVPPPPALQAALERLTERLGLDYAAADLKTDPRTGKLLFMEVNTMPMFTGYDNAAQGRLSDAIFLELRRLSEVSATPARPRPPRKILPPAP